MYAHFESSRGASFKHFLLRKTFDGQCVIAPWSDDDRCEREEDACWRLKADVFETVQQSQYYFYNDE